MTTARESLRPPPDVKISEWALRFRVLTKKDTAKPGRWKSQPHQDAIMDAFCDPSVRTVVVKAASQLVGKSQMMNNIIGYYADVDPSNMMIVHPSIAAAEKWSKGRLDPLIEATPSLVGKFPARKSRDGESTILHRQFRGGQMFIVGVNAPADLSAQSVRIVLADEVDRYPTGSGQGDRDEGDPLDLAIQRTETYGDFAKVGMFSTPLLEGLSRIDSAFQESDRNEWELECPHCEEFFAPLWQHVRWTKRDNGKIDLPSVAMWCPCCGTRFEEGDRIRAIEAGRFDPKAEFDGTRGFHISALGCLGASLQKLARQWEKAQGAPQRIKAFVNLKLGECFKEQGEAPPWERLRDRREPWPANLLPWGVRFITIGVDTQGDRLEARVWGFGRDKQAFHLHTEVIPGNLFTRDPWEQLEELAKRTWKHPSGAYLGVVRLAIDTGGHHTSRVYEWVRRQNPRQTMAIKGDSHAGAAVFREAKSAEINRRGKWVKSGVKPWLLNTDLLKGLLYGRLRLERAEKEGGGYAYPPGYVHLSERVAEDEVRQLVAEELVFERSKRTGRTVRRWHLPAGKRNEALDCFNYAHAAAIAFGLDTFTDRRWDELEASLGITPEERPPEDPDPEGEANDSAFPPPPPPPRPPATPPRVERVGRGRRIHHPTF